MADEQFNQRPGANFDPQTGEPLHPVQQMFDSQTGEPLQQAQQPSFAQAYPQPPAQQPVMQQQCPPTGQLAYPQPIYSSDYQVPVVERPNQPSTLGNWILTIIVSCIPVVGIIVLLVWAFGDTADVSKKRWAQAMLILYVVFFVIGIIAMTVFGVTLTSIIE